MLPLMKARFAVTSHVIVRLHETKVAVSYMPD